MLQEQGVIVEVAPIDLLGFDNVELEVGSGKGKFISELALDNPLTLFIAFEVNMNVLYRILEKRNENKINNLILVLGDASNLNNYFSKGSINNIYLNFSDPWPKARHHKRRLTFPKFLRTYQNLLKVDGKVLFRTDHKEFYLDSISYFKEVFKDVSCNADFKESNYMSEYEIKKRKNGPIMQIIGGGCIENSELI